MEHPVNSSVRTIMNQHADLRPGDTILLAVSGGQDSCALLHSLIKLRSELGIEVVAAHFNHESRGEDSDADEAFLAQLTSELGIPFHSNRAGVQASARRTHQSFHEAARMHRNEFLDWAAQTADAKWIATGHTRNDHIETVLHNILRGSGLTGLAGLQPTSGNRIRPLLHATRADTENYCVANNIAFRTDASNQTNKYTRNRIRLDLIPMLSEIVPGFSPDAIARLSDFAYQDDACLIDLAREWFETHSQSTSSGCTIPTSDFGSLHVALRGRVLRLAIEQVASTCVDVEWRHLEPFVEADESASLSVDLPNGVRIRHTEGVITVEEIAPMASPVPLEWKLEIGCTTRIQPWNVEMTTDRVDNTYHYSGDPFELVLPTSAIKGGLVVRNRRPGDRMQPTGMNGSKKIQDILVDAKIPLILRDQTPIVADDDGPLWIVGVRRSQRTEGIGEQSRLKIVVKSSKSSR
ncbi:MAG: tRNA lysidine(34) synthetase TilS [Chthonomonadales bacterium]